MPGHSQRKSPMKPALALAPLLLLASGPAMAHLDPSHHGSFMAGVTHPLSGLDHILAMLAVGLWAAMIGGRALWALPAAFVGAMAAGFALSLAGMPLPGVEPMILASVMVLGLLVALAVRMPVGPSLALVGIFGLFHGHAHGGELGVATAATFGLGFALATAALHGTGLGLGLGLNRALASGSGRLALRGLGVVTALGGAWLAAA